MVELLPSKCKTLSSNPREHKRQPGYEACDLGHHVDSTIADQVCDIITEKNLRTSLVRCEVLFSKAEKQVNNHIPIGQRGGHLRSMPCLCIRHIYKAQSL
jgi:hypothetical protein